MTLAESSVALCFLWVMCVRVNKRDVQIWHCVAIFKSNLPVSLTGSVSFSAAGTLKIYWEIKLRAVFSFASVIKPWATSCPTSKESKVCWTLSSCLFTALLIHLTGRAFPPKGPRQVPPFCHHPESRWTVRHIRRLPGIRQPHGADRALQSQPHPALWRAPDLKLLRGEEITESLINSYAACRRCTLT